jgi:hypothetical protein
MLLSCAIVTLQSNAGEITPGQALQVQYKNVSHATAHTIYFQATVNGRRGTVSDKGKFSPGVTIKHDLFTSSFLRTQETKPQSCIVAAVEFTNGTKWVNPNAHL